MSSLTKWQHFSVWNDSIATIECLMPTLPRRRRCQMENPVRSIGAHLLEEHSCQISSRFDIMKRRSFRLSWRGRSNNNTNNNNNNNNKMMSSDMRSVPVLKIDKTIRRRYDDACSHSHWLLQQPQPCAVIAFFAPAVEEHWLRGVLMSNEHAGVYKGVINGIWIYVSSKHTLLCNSET